MCVCGLNRGSSSCAPQLKTLLDTEQYKSIVYRFIKFDDEMALLTFKWREIWTLLNAYHLSDADRSRRDRMFTVHSILRSIRDSDFPVDPVEDTKLNTLNWMTMTDRNVAWRSTVLHLRKHVLEQMDPRLLVAMTNVKCVQCKVEQATHNV